MFAVDHSAASVRPSRQTAPVPRRRHRDHIYSQRARSARSRFAGRDPFPHGVWDPDTPSTARPTRGSSRAQVNTGAWVRDGELPRRIDPTCAGGIQSARLHAHWPHRAACAASDPLIPGGIPSRSTFSRAPPRCCRPGSPQTDPTTAPTSRASPGLPQLPRARRDGPITLSRLEVSCYTVFYRSAYDMWVRDAANTRSPPPADPVRR